MSGIRRTGRLVALAGLVVSCATVFAGTAYAGNHDGADGEPGESVVKCDGDRQTSDSENQCNEYGANGEDGEDGASSGDDE